MTFFKAMVLIAFTAHLLIAAAFAVVVLFLLILGTLT
jgi:hypothetical protein